MPRALALLRAVNVGGRKLPMAELRALCLDLGWKRVETYIQSGNIAFAASDPAAEASRLEQAIGARFGFHSDVIIRSSAQWTRIIEANPFPQASLAEPNRVLTGLAKAELEANAAAAILAKARDGERVEQAGGALWFHYQAGVGASRITPALIDRAAGSPVTARNWRTMLKLGEVASS